MKTFVLSLAALAIGLLAGIAFMQYKTRLVAAAAPAASVPPSAVPRAALPPDANFPALGQWDPFAEMRRMQQEMDRAFNNSIAQLHRQPPFNAFPDAPGYSLSLDVREFKDRFEVHAALPDAKANDIHVKLDDDRTLTVEVGNKAENSTNQTGPQGSTATTAEEWGDYSQTIQLPSPVEASRMKTEHKDHELVIILPKAA